MTFEEVVDIAKKDPWVEKIIIAIDDYSHERTEGHSLIDPVNWGAEELKFAAIIFNAPKESIHNTTEFLRVIKSMQNEKDGGALLLQYSK